MDGYRRCIIGAGLGLPNLYLAPTNALYTGFSANYTIS